MSLDLNPSSLDRSIEPLANPTMMGTGPAVVSAKAVSAIATLCGCASGDGGRIRWRLYALAGAVCVVTRRAGWFSGFRSRRLRNGLLLWVRQPRLITARIAMLASGEVSLRGCLLDFRSVQIGKL